MTDQRAFELKATFGSRAPFRILADGGIVLNLELSEGALDTVTQLYKTGKGKDLRILIEVREPERFGEKQLEGQTAWIPEQTV